MRLVVCLLCGNHCSFRSNHDACGFSIANGYSRGHSGPPARNNDFAEKMDTEQRCKWVVAAQEDFDLQIVVLAFLYATESFISGTKFLLKQFAPKGNVQSFKLPIRASAK